MLIFDFAHSLASDFRVNGRYRASHTHVTTARSVTDFCGGVSPTLKTVYTKSFLYRYQEYLTGENCKRNTISFYMSRLRSLYHMAVDLKLVKYTPDLFSDVFTGSDPTEKRAVGSEVIATLQSADLSDNLRLDRCRDLFMLSFYLQGMAFVDLAYLRKSDIAKSSIVYHRHKTRSLVTVSLSDEAKDILTKYKDEVKDTPYALPILTLSGEEGYCQYNSALRRHNRQLKALAKHLSIAETLTSYVARHSWATIAYHNGVRVSVLSQAMGHQTEEVTRIYLSTFDLKELAEANRKVIMVVRQSGKGKGKGKGKGESKSKSVNNNPAKTEDVYMRSRKKSKRRKPRGNGNFSHCRRRK